MIADAKVPFKGWRQFINEFGQYVATRETPDTLALSRYRDAQGDDVNEADVADVGCANNLCRFCGARYVPGCNSGGCA